VAPHRRRHGGVPRCLDAGTVQIAPRVRGVRGGCLVIPWHETPGPRFPGAHDVVGDAQSRPVEIAVIAQPGAGLRQLGEQGSLRGGRHAVGTDQRGAAGAHAVGGDGHQIRILAHVHRHIGHRPPWRRPQQATQRQVTGFAKCCRKQRAGLNRQIKEQRGPEKWP